MKDSRKLGRLMLGGGLGAIALALATGAMAQLLVETGAQSGRGRKVNLYNGPDATLQVNTSDGDSGAAPPGSAAPNKDPRDLSGHWLNYGHRTLFGPEGGMPPPLRPKYMAMLEKRIRNKNSGIPEGDASTQCFPHGVPRAFDSPYPVEIIQTPAAHGQPAQITILMETLHNIRRLYLTDTHNAKLGESFMGESIAHWEGDDLVVHTTKLNDRTFIDDEGSTHSTKEEVIEHIHKSGDGKTLEVLSTVIDPVTLWHPYTFRVALHWRPDIRTQEYVCEENNRNKVDEHGITQAK